MERQSPLLVAQRCLVLWNDSSQAPPVEEENTAIYSVDPGQPSKVFQLDWLLHVLEERRSPDGIQDLSPLQVVIGYTGSYHGGKTQQELLSLFRQNSVEVQDHLRVSTFTLVGDREAEVDLPVPCSEEKPGGEVAGADSFLGNGEFQLLCSGQSFHVDMEE